MSKIVKEKIEQHAVIVDTNILFDQDKSNVVNKKFDVFWCEHSLDANLHLALPEVVIGEILFQQTTSALKTLSRANESFDRLSSFTGKSYSHRVNESRVRSEITQRFRGWARSRRYEELETPTKSIDWDTIVDASIWRKPPFSYDPKKEELEKGFRDALILETIVSYCEREVTKKIVFVSNDKLLRDSAEHRLRGHPTFSVFETLDDFEAYLRLEKENLEQSFIKSVVNKAAKKFFTYQDKSSLVYRIDLINLLGTEFSEKFENPASLLPDDFEGGFYSDNNWRPTSRALYAISEKPQFQRIEGDNTYVWRSRVRYHRDYEGASDWGNDTYIFKHEEFFHVYWRTNISVNERFTKMEFIEVKHIESKFEETGD